MNDIAKLEAKDFASDQDVRWCPGCGDYSILKAVQKTLAQVGAQPENTVFVSGIGCAARFPYYINSYGFHTIHGRGAAVATGVKLANPQVDVWVVGGDGDSLAIGGNHLLHLLRRNVNLQYLLINNQIYGLTKGQASPTSAVGLRTPSSPAGVLDEPVNACAFALGSGARFVARSGDVMQAHLNEVLARAHSFRGTGFVEILQNCPVYNDGAFGAVMDKAVMSEAQLVLRHGEKMLFGDEGALKGVAFDAAKMALEIVEVADEKEAASRDDILVHDETNIFLANLLVRMERPFAMGVIYATPDSVPFDEAFNSGGGIKKRNLEELDKLLHSGNSWTVGSLKDAARKL